MSYTASAPMPYAWTSSVLDQDRRIPGVIIILFPFVLGAVSVTALEGFNWAVWIMGIICVAAFLIDSLRGMVRLQPEVLLYTGFLGWALLGVVNAAYVPVFWVKYFTLAQFAVMLLMLTHYAANRRAVHVLLAATFGGILIVAASGMLSGDFQRAEAGEARIAGIAINANQFAINCVQAAAVCLYAFHVRKGLLSRGLFAGLLIVLVWAIIASGSRTGFFGFVTLLLAWFWLVYFKQVKRNPVMFLGGAVLVLIIGGALYVGMSGSLLARRMQVITQERGEGIREYSAIMRRQLYQEGLAMLLHHPVAGIGVNQFIVDSAFSKYSHSNYIEVFTSTGVLGGLLYYSVLLVFGLRLRRLRKACESAPRSLSLVKLGQTLLVTVLVMDFAHVSWTDKSTWVLLAIVMGWSYRAEHLLKAAAAEAAAQPMPGYTAVDTGVGGQVGYTGYLAGRYP